MRFNLARIWLPLAALALLFAGQVAAQPTVEEVRLATAAGVQWLAGQQNDDGSWGDWEVCSVTAMAVKKLEHHAVDARWGMGLPSPFHPDYPYRVHVEKALAYLLERCSGVAPIGPQPAGDPDTDGDGVGVYFGDALHHRSYATGVALMAICEAVELDRTVELGPLAGQTLEEVARDAMDFLAFGQNDAGWERGGWGYYENYVGWSDNSNTGYVMLGLGFAEAAWPAGCGFLLPDFVKSELNLWIDYIQNDVDGDANDGGSGYNSPDNWVNVLKTGNLLQQFAMVGDPPDSPRVLAAMDYLKRHWYDPDKDPGWIGPGTSPFGMANYQATYALMKGLTGMRITEFGGIDWAVDFETVLLAEQLPDGSWPTTTWDYGNNRVLSTTWALLTLQRAAPPPPFIPVALDVKPESCRNPFNLDKNGVVPAAVLGSDSFDVTQIDPATVMLEGVAPLRWAYEDVATPYEPFLGKEGCFACTTLGPDGYMDVTFKFDAPTLAALYAEAFDGDCVVMTLTGQLKEEFGGRMIMGEDVVVILR